MIYKETKGRMKYHDCQKNKQKSINHLLLVFYAVSMFLRMILHKESEITYLYKIELNLFWSKLLAVYDMLSPVENILLFFAIFWFIGGKDILMKVLKQKKAAVDLLFLILAVLIIGEIVLSSYAIILRHSWKHWDIIISTPVLNLCFMILLFEINFIKHIRHIIAVGKPGTITYL